MKLFTVDLARTVWMFDTSVLTPNGISAQGLFEELVAKYHFKKYPAHVFDLDSEKSLRFEEGEFLVGDRRISVSFSIYNDGVVADTRSSTDDSTAFLQETLRWIQAKHRLDFVANENEVEIGYVSQVTVVTDKTLASLNPKLDSFINELEAETKDRSGKPRSYDVASLSIWGTEGGRPSHNTGFKFEMRLGRPLSEKKYFSQAPVRTERHLHLLDRLELILATDSQ